MKHTLLGLAIGDALGAPFEFNTVEQIQQINWRDNFENTSLWGGLKKGQYTDDTKKAICLAESLIDCQGFNPEDLANKYLAWYKSGDLRGIGNTCEKAFNNLKNGISFLHSAPELNKKKLAPAIRREGIVINNNDFCGNGTVMSCAPIGVYFRNNPDQLFEASVIDAVITHNHPDAKDANLALSNFIANLCNNADKFNSFDIILQDQYELDHVPKHLLKVKDIINNCSRMEDFNLIEAGKSLGVRGTAHETLATAVLAFLLSDNFKEAVVNAVRMGGDTDSRAAIAGALAGSYYQEIPKEYLEQVENSEYLQKLDKKLWIGPDER